PAGRRAGPRAGLVGQAGHGEPGTDPGTVKPGYSGTLLGALLLVVVTIGPAAAAPASAPPDDRILPLGMYQTEKARILAQRHERALRDLNTEIYHCLPWVDVSKHSIGFFKPKGATDDDRYLSIRLYVDQQPSPEFDRLTIAERASAMFSRYVGPMLRRMTRHAELLNDDAIGGFITSVWGRGGGAARTQPRPAPHTTAAL